MRKKTSFIPQKNIINESIHGTTIVANKANSTTVTKVKKMEYMLNERCPLQQKTLCRGSFVETIFKMPVSFEAL